MALSRTVFAAPGVRGVDDDRLYMTARIVAPVERQVGLLDPGAIAEMRIVPDKLAA